jgi:hypothetical protein
VESLRGDSPEGDNPELESSQPEPTREELLKELRALEVWLATHEPELPAAMNRLSTFIGKYIDDREKAKEIRRILEQPPTEA